MDGVPITIKEGGPSLCHYSTGAQLVLAKFISGAVCIAASWSKSYQEIRLKAQGKSKIHSGLASLSACSFHSAIFCKKTSCEIGFV